MKRFNFKRFTEIKEQVETEIDTLSISSLKALYVELKAMHEPYHDPNSVMYRSLKQGITVFLILSIVGIVIILLYPSIINLWVGSIMLSLVVAFIIIVFIDFTRLRKLKEFKKFIEKDCEILRQKLWSKRKMVENYYVKIEEELLKVIDFGTDTEKNIKSSIKEWKKYHTASD